MYHHPQGQTVFNLTCSLMSLQVFASLEDTKFVFSTEDKNLVHVDLDVEESASTNNTGCPKNRTKTA